jgi:hypothetical protein
MVGHARFRIDFHPAESFGFGVDVTCEHIGVRIMLWAPKVLNFDDLLGQTGPLPITAEAKVKFRQNLPKTLNF